MPRDVAMRFTHTADCHIGGWRDTRLKRITELAFERFIGYSIAEKADFIIIAGDLFNTAIPGIDTLKFVVTQLGKAKQQNIPVYAIPGSHDYSPSGKTMLDVLEEAGLLINVCRGTIQEDKLVLSFTVDQKTGAKLTGVIGKRGMLDRQIYEELNLAPLEREPGCKIFLFHTALTELKPKHLAEMESYPVSFLPKNFNYYAGGHVHIVENQQLPGYENLVYPGPLFPNSFSELEKLQHGGFFLYDDGKIAENAVTVTALTRRTLPSAEDKALKGEHQERNGENRKGVVPYGEGSGLRKMQQDASSAVTAKVTRIPIDLVKTEKIHIDLDKMTANAANQIVMENIMHANVQGKIVLLRLEGTLSSGSAAEIDLRHCVQQLEQNGALIVLRNTARLSSQEFQAVSTQHHHADAHEIEERLLEEHAGQLAIKELPNIDGKELAKQLLQVLSREQHDGEKVYEHQERVVQDALNIIDEWKKR